MARTCLASCLSVAFAIACGCGIRDNSTRPVEQPVIIEKPIPDTAAVQKIEQLKTTVETSANSTQNSLSGLVNASVSKLAERVTGLEAKIDKVVGVELKVDKLQTDLSAEFKASANADLRASIKELNAEFKAQLNAVAQASLDIGKKVDTRLEQISATAGRDVNMLPQTAVDVIVQTAQTFAGVIATLCGLASSVVVVMARNSRKRAEQRAQLERDERKQMYDLLQQLIKK